MSRLPARVTVVAPNWLGDAVMSLPLLGLLTNCDDVACSVVSRPYAARVYQGVEGLDDLYVTRAGGRSARIRQATDFFRANRSDAAIVLPPSFSSVIAPTVARTRVRAGVRAGGRTALLTDSLEASRAHHLAETYLSIGRAALARLGVGTTAAPAPRMTVTSPERQEASAVLEQKGCRPRGYFVLVPGATYGPTKRWPAERYRELATRIAPETSVVVAGVRKERALADEVASGIDNVFNVAGELSLGGFIALLSVAKCVVANDSGAPHLAASLGTPVRVIFGSTSPEWTAPVGADVRALRHPVHCSPCFRRRCPTELECFDGISVDEVYASLR